MLSDLENQIGIGESLWHEKISCAKGFLLLIEAVPNLITEDESNQKLGFYLSVLQ